MSWRTLTHITLAAAFVAACSMMVAGTDRLLFSHKAHEGEAECGDCHGEVAEAQTLGGALEPGHDQCFECHDDEEENCAFCHADPKYAGKQAPERVPITFSHEIHVEESEGDCRVCHAGVMDSQDLRDVASPWTHQRCMTCHRDEVRQVRCGICHGDMAAWKERPYAIFDHDGDFMARHGVAARGNLVVCQHCHQDDECASCHANTRPTRPSIRNRPDVAGRAMHRGDFLSRHAIEAGLDRARCYTCHDSRDCADCHRERGVTLAGAAFRHPSGWMQAGSASFHGREARRRVAFCAGCHDKGEASNCVACHRVGGAGGNPHPGEDFDANLDKHKDMPCRICH